MLRCVNEHRWTASGPMTANTPPTCPVCGQPSIFCSSADNPTLPLLADALVLAQDVTVCFSPSAENTPARLATSRAVQPSIWHSSPCPLEDKSSMTPSTCPRPKAPAIPSRIPRIRRCPSCGPERFSFAWRSSHSLRRHGGRAPQAPPRRGHHPNSEVSHTTEFAASGQPASAPRPVVFQADDSDAAGARAP